jgi:hypothetical protein
MSTAQWSRSSNESTGATAPTVTSLSTRGRAAGGVSPCAASATSRVPGRCSMASANRALAASYFRTNARRSRQLPAEFSPARSPLSCSGRAHRDRGRGGLGARAQRRAQHRRGPPRWRCGPPMVVEVALSASVARSSWSRSRSPGAGLAAGHEAAAIAHVAGRWWSRSRSTCAWCASSVAGPVPPWIVVDRAAMATLITPGLRAHAALPHPRARTRDRMPWTRSRSPRRCLRSADRDRSHRSVLGQLVVTRARLR